MPPDRTVTGFSGNGKRTTFFTRSGESIHTRNIREEEARWLALGPLLVFITAVLIPISSLVWPGEKVFEPVVANIILGLYTVMFLAGIRSGRFIWRELLLVGSMAWLLSEHDTLGQGELWFAAGAILLCMIGYLVLWVQRSIWEPFVLALFITGMLMAFQVDLLPHSALMWVSSVLAVFAFFFWLFILGDSASYEHWTRNLRD